MIASKETEYRQLERDSSNLLMEADSRRVLGRYEEAAHALSEAGGMRWRMGQIAVEASDFAAAAEDWLSSVECYLRVSAEQQAVAVLELVQQLEAQGRIPAERPDLATCLRQREEAVRRLAEQLSIAPR